MKLSDRIIAMAQDCRMVEREKEAKRLAEIVRQIEALPDQWDDIGWGDGYDITRGASELRVIIGD